MATSSDTVSSLYKWSVPLSMLATIVGGSAWLTSTRNQVQYVAIELNELKADYRDEKTQLAARLTKSEDNLSQVKQKLSAIDAKLDIVLSNIKRRHE